jgi:outer membrane protein OmpA-like peptidoglycan-associated protein
MGEGMFAIRHLLVSSFSMLAVVLMIGALGAGSAVAAQDCKRPPGGKVHVPKSVNFDLNSTEIGEQDEKQLMEMAQRFAGNPNIEICLVGMTDRSGNAEHNKMLAMERAEAVEKLLKANGLSGNKFQLVARGQAFADDSWIGKLLGSKPSDSNRRVDVLFME